ncbi:MAG: hypothetical protein A3B38_02360 [Candidatus Levybacteria bacterium RIFCSPLOWO2_01_FULL_36_13]|nr:MAG: hypothetical protein A2684_03555 [Candidatus Levybacteria bacterium RIFCSPHIGHO2_01_FULL_36_15b]OGH35130.1 MAG: hypothetical protein A3B38_02360 [Candidatus Levybacteria bacterium RIFCSPLOWO2_01_FULL_36_13]
MKELNFHLRADEVADLDPYNVRGKPVQQAAEDLLGDEPENGLEGAFNYVQETTLVVNEKLAWERVFGLRPEIGPLPPYFTHEMKEKLEENGFNFIYIPHLELENGWRGLSTAGYLSALQRDYPNWKALEYLPDIDRDNPNVPKNLSQTFWDDVERGNIPFPQLPGKWIAVEHRDGSFMEDHLGINFYNSDDWSEILSGITMKQQKALEELDLWGFRAHIRLPEAIEWNLLANRFGWGSPGEWDWTSTETNENEIVVMGLFDDKINSEFKLVSKQRKDFLAQPIIDFSLET